MAQIKDLPFKRFNRLSPEEKLEWVRNVRRIRQHHSIPVVEKKESMADIAAYLWRRAGDNMSKAVKLLGPEMIKDPKQCTIEDLFPQKEEEGAEDEDN